MESQRFLELPWSDTSCPTHLETQYHRTVSKHLSITQTKKRERKVAERASEKERGEQSGDERGGGVEKSLQYTTLTSTQCSDSIKYAFIILSACHCHTIQIQCVKHIQNTLFVVSEIFFPFYCHIGPITNVKSSYIRSADRLRLFVYSNTQA